VEGRFVAAVLFAHRHRAVEQRSPKRAFRGYHVRFRRTLAEAHPTLASIDSEPLAIERDYGAADARKVLADFRMARIQTMEIVSSLSDAQLQRTAVFEGYGPLTMRSLVHYLCSHDQQHLAGLQWLAGKIDASTLGT
jgi:hypothetical protein